MEEKVMVSSEIFDLKNFDRYKEDNRREVKQALGGLPVNLWSTYSAFANTEGGVILLGITEQKDGSWKPAGLSEGAARKLKKDFWDTVNNPNKVSANILTEKDFQIFNVDGHAVLSIEVPPAPREDKPVFLDRDMFGKTYRRNFEGDYRCSQDQVRLMVRDQGDKTTDTDILEEIPLDYLNAETVQAYRNRHELVDDEHPFSRLGREEYLRSIGAAGISPKDGQYHPTGAGLLMFGEEYNIILRYPRYFLDYREVLDPAIRWTDRVHSSSGKWSGNVFDFYFRIYNKICKEVKVPFKMVGGTRIDQTPVHKALWEALANCLTNADYFGSTGVVIMLENHKLTITNPGYIRVGKEQVRKGGISDPRNGAMMKMFNLIDIGERAGSGVPGIFQVWEDEGFEPPELVESYNPDRTTLTLSFERKRRNRTGGTTTKDKHGTPKEDRKTKPSPMVTQKTRVQLATLLEKMEPGKWYSRIELMEMSGVKVTRIKELLSILLATGDIIDNGVFKGRRYRRI